MNNQYGVDYNQENGYLPLVSKDEFYDYRLYKWSDDGRKFIYKLPIHRLQPGSKYEIKFKEFISQQYVFMDKKESEIEIIYKTAEK